MVPRAAGRPAPAARDRREWQGRSWTFRRRGTPAERRAAYVLRLHLARIAVRRGRFEPARAQLAAGVQAAIAADNRSYQFMGLLCFAELLEAEGRRDLAQALLGYCAQHPDIGVPERESMRERLDGKSPAEWKGPGMKELLHRVVVEKDVAHAPLLAAIGR